MAGNVETLILRFRDLATDPGDTIRLHKDICVQSGYVWWGWWAKGGEKVPAQVFSELNAIAEENGLEIFLFDSDSRALYKATCTGIEFRGEQIPSPEPNRTPDYYPRPCPAWFKLSDIKAEPDENALRKYSYVEVKEFFQRGEPRFERFNSKVIWSTVELAQQERTIWFIRKATKKDPDYDIYQLDPSDLQLLVTLAPDQKTLSYTLNSPGGDYNFLELGSVTLSASPREVLQHTFNCLSTLAYLSPTSRTPEQTQQAMRDLADIGSNLYDELLPDTFKDEYCTLREKYLGCNLWLTSNEPWIPWEIVRPVAYDERGVLLYDDAPLCELFRLARWVSGAAPPARLALKRAVVVRPPANLKATSIETEYFAGLPGVVQGLAVADPVETVDETLKAFGVGQTQLYHFACHGNFDLTDPDDSKLKLADGFLKPSQLRKGGLRRAQPWVFVNACHAGERGFGLTRLGGWAERFIAAGASVFVGTLWEINDDLAARFAVEFYNRFFGLEGQARQSLGQAFREARLVLKELDPANPTWLAYVLYGNPHAEFSA
jgi:hypothetical protein